MTREFCYGVAHVVFRGLRSGIGLRALVDSLLIACSFGCNQQDLSDVYGKVIGGQCHGGHDTLSGRALIGSSACDMETETQML